MHCNGKGGALFSCSLQSRLALGKLTMKDLLTGKQGWIACQKGNSEISRYVATNVDELINEALFGELKSSVVAMQIISCKNRLILSALCKGTKVKDAAAKVMEKPSFRVVGCLCMIILECLEVYSDAIDGAFSFIPELLDLADHDYVVKLFESLLDWQVQSSITKFWKGIGIVSVLIGKLKKVKDFWTKVGLYKLLNACAGNFEYENECKSDIVVDFVCGQVITEEQNDLQVQQWKFLIKALTMVDSLSAYKVGIPKALIVAGSNNGNQASVEALNFLTAARRLEKVLIPSSFIQSLTAAFAKFCDHTIFLSAFSQFVLAYVKDTETAPLIGKYVFHVLRDAIESPKSRVHTAYALELCKNISEIACDDMFLRHLITTDESFSNLLQNLLDPNRSPTGRIEALPAEWLLVADVCPPTLLLDA